MKTVRGCNGWAPLYEVVYEKKMKREGQQYREKGTQEMKEGQEGLSPEVVELRGMRPKQL